MLVKFISFVITIFGTKRHQPVVFASIALIISVIGVTTVLNAYDTPTDSAASTANHTDDQTTETLPKQTPATKSLRSDADAGQNSQQNPDTPTSTPPTTGTAAGGQKPAATAPTIQVTPSTSSLTLKAGETSTAISAMLSDASSAQWSITSDPANDITITSVGQDTNISSSKTSFTVKASAAGTYTLSIHGKDTARGVDVTKTITLSVTAN